MSHRRRALLLGGLALLLGGLAASNVAGREAALERRVGGLVDVVVAREPIAAGERVAMGSLAIRRVPARFAPDATTGTPQAVVGRRAAVDIPAEADLNAGMIVREDEAGPAGPDVRPGERVAEIVALGSPDLVMPGSRVDVLVTPEPAAGAAGDAVLALENVGGDRRHIGRRRGCARRQGSAGCAGRGVAARDPAPGGVPRRRAGLRAGTAAAAALQR